MEKNWGKHWKEEGQNSLTHQWAWFYFYGNELITANFFFLSSYLIREVLFEFR